MSVALSFRQSGAGAAGSAALVVALSLTLPAFLRSSVAAQPPATPAETLTAPPTGDSGPWYTWPQIQAKVAEWKRLYPHLVQETVLGKTVEGRPIPLLRLSDDQTVAENEPEVLLVVGIHPREQAPQFCLIRLVDELLAGAATNPRYARLLKERQIWLVPMLNVDGKIYDMKRGNSPDKAADWRKNRRPNPDGSFGVDLNRNFGVRWGGNRAFNDTWKTDTVTAKDNIYEGPAPLSEPETRALTEFIASRPRLTAFMDIHSPLAVFIFPQYTVGEEHQRFQRLARGMQSRQKRPYPLSKSIKADTEPSAGSRGGDTGLTYTWAYYTQGVYGFNLELGTSERARGIAGRYPSLQDMEAEYKENFREPLLFFLDAFAELKPATPGSATCPGDWKVEGTPAPGAVLTLTPPPVQGACDWAVLVSSSPLVAVQSEFRLYPWRSGFTIELAKNLPAGTTVPFTLYLWNKARQVSTVQWELRIR